MTTDLRKFAEHCRRMVTTTKPVEVGRDRNGDPVMAPVPTAEQRGQWLRLAEEAERR